MKKLLIVISIVLAVTLVVLVSKLSGGDDKLQGAVQQATPAEGVEASKSSVSSDATKPVSKEDIDNLATADKEIGVTGQDANVTSCIKAYGAGTYGQALIECAYAAHKGSSEAMTYMGGMYYEGLGVKQDYKEAFNWYSQAAEKGWPAALFSLGKMYEKGHGVAVDYEKAFDYLKKAAAKGDVYSLYNIGFFYGKGYVGDKPDFEKAAQWFEKAANKRHAHGMYGLSTLYQVGRGVEHDPVKAYMWISLAAKYGIPEAHTVKKTIEATLTPEQLKDAENQIQAWEKTHP